MTPLLPETREREGPERGEREIGSSFYGNCRGKRKPVGFYLELYRDKGERDELRGRRRESEWRRVDGGTEGRGGRGETRERGWIV